MSFRGRFAPLRISGSLIADNVAQQRRARPPQAPEPHAALCPDAAVTPRRPRFARRRALTRAPRLSRLSFSQLRCRPRPRGLGRLPRGLHPLQQRRGRRGRRRALLQDAGRQCGAADVRLVQPRDRQRRLRPLPGRRPRRRRPRTVRAALPPRLLLGPRAPSRLPVRPQPQLRRRHHPGDVHRHRRRAVGPGAAPDGRGRGGAGGGVDVRRRARGRAAGGQLHVGDAGRAAPPPAPPARLPALSPPLVPLSRSSGLPPLQLRWRRCSSTSPTASTPPSGRAATPCATTSPTSASSGSPS